MKEYFDTFDTLFLKEKYQKIIDNTPFFRLKDYMIYVSMINSVLGFDEKEFCEEITKIVDFNTVNSLNRKRRNTLKSPSHLPAVSQRS